MSISGNHGSWKKNMYLCDIYTNLGNTNCNVVVLKELGEHNGKFKAFYH